MRNRLHLLLAFAFVLSLILVPAASAAQNDHAVVLSADKAAFSAAEPVIVHTTITNTTGRTMRILRWFTPADGVEEPLFNVVRDGQPVPYLGPVVKRPPANAADFVIVAPGESITYDVDLASIYDLSTTGAYVVAYDIARLSSASLTLLVEGPRQWTDRAGGARRHRGFHHLQ